MTHEAQTAGKQARKRRKRRERKTCLTSEVLSLERKEEGRREEGQSHRISGRREERRCTKVTQTLLAFPFDEMISVTLVGLRLPRQLDRRERESTFCFDYGIRFFRLLLLIISTEELRRTMPPRESSALGLGRCTRSYPRLSLPLSLLICPLI